jgi:hypothetical protein
LSKFFETFGPPRIPVTGSGGEPASAEPGRRRSSRWKAFIPVFVYGYGSGQEPFHEESYSAVVSETGGLLVMRACVQPGHSLLVTNRATGEERECRVAYVGAREPDQWAVAVEFREPAAAFWRLTTRIGAEVMDGKKQNGRG